MAHIAVSLVLAVAEPDLLPHLLARVPPWLDEVLIVVPARFTATATRLAAPWARVTVVSQLADPQETALLTGCRAAHGTLMIGLVGDGTMDPANLAGLAGTTLVQAPGQRC